MKKRLLVLAMVLLTCTSIWAGTGERDALASQTSQQNAEYEKLEPQKSQSNQVMYQLQAIAKAEQDIRPIKYRFLQLIGKKMQELEEIKVERITSYLTKNPIEPWETSSEYDARVKEYSETIDRDNREQVRELEIVRDAEVDAIGLDRMKSELMGTLFTVGSEIHVAPFEAEHKRFPMKSISLDAKFPFEISFFYPITTTDQDEIRQEYQRIEQADKAKALSCELTFSLLELYPGIWSASVVSWRLINLLEGTSDAPEVVMLLSDDTIPEDPAVVSLIAKVEKEVFIIVQDGNVRNVYGILPITSAVGPARVFLGEKDIGTTNTVYVAETEQEAGEKTFTFVLSNGAHYDNMAIIQSGMNKPIILYIVGGAGPAGGIVFYDKGSYIDGWRYLESAPSSTEWVKKVWGGYRTGVFMTDTEVGKGAINTKVIIATYGDTEPHSKKNNYAAKLCFDLIYNGYTDWFLPSKDELDLMYTNLHKNGIGGFSEWYYWSSSEYNKYEAWYQSFIVGERKRLDKDSIVSVRAVRAF